MEDVTIFGGLSGRLGELSGRRGELLSSRSGDLSEYLNRSLFTDYDRVDRYWNHECAFPNVQFSIYENVEQPPSWFSELLMTAYIDDYEKVSEFEGIIKRWKMVEAIKYKNQVLALFSQNEVAFPYLSMGFNLLLDKKESFMNKSFLIDIDKAYLDDYEEQKRYSEGQKLTVGDYVCKKVDLSSMLRGTFGRALYAISRFRKDKPNELFTEQDVEAFLNKVFKNANDEPFDVEQAQIVNMAAGLFFQAIEKYEKANDVEPTKLLQSSKMSLTHYMLERDKLRYKKYSREQVFLQEAFTVIQRINGFPEYLLKFKEFVYNVNKFVDFAKKYISYIVEKGTSCIKEHQQKNNGS